MTRLTPLIAALMFGGATAAWAAGTAVDRQAAQPLGAGATAGAATVDPRPGTGAEVLHARPDAVVEPHGAAAGAGAVAEPGLRQQLEAMGYTQISQFDFIDGEWAGMALRDGHVVQLRIDANTGEVRERPGTGRPPG